jgi:SAM-dependent methyltransferase
VILCHNVFEYANEREEIINEFSRILKKKGYLSILKHNRAGRVMQMVVLLNNFEHANELLEGKIPNSGYLFRFSNDMGLTLDGSCDFEHKNFKFV